jgi:ABC-2 type transport system permease protein
VTAASTAFTEGWTVARHEFLHHLKRRGFLLTTFGLPIVGLLFGVLIGSAGGLVGRGIASALEVGGEAVGRPAVRIGYVDPGGFIARTPSEMDARFVVYGTADEARVAVLDGAVDAAYVLPATYPVDQTVERLAIGLRDQGRDTLPFEQLLRANLWPAGSAAAVADLAVPARRVDLALDPARYRLAKGNVIAIAVPLLLGVFLYIAIFTGSSFLLQSLTTEKESRVIEILLTSTRPMSLLTGKLLGLGALGLLQMLVWSVFAIIVSGPVVGLLMAVGGLALGPKVVLAGFAYFLLGYFFYGSLMAAVGAVSPSFRESGALTFVVLFPAWIPFFALQAILADPNGTAATVFSLLPPTAPLVGMIRVVSADVPTGQLVLSLALLALGALVVLLAAARLFQASILLASGAPSWRGVWRALKGMPTA